MEYCSLQPKARKPINRFWCLGRVSLWRLIPASRLCLTFAAAVLFSATGAQCDDSIARFGAGGIEFLQSQEIRMLEEVLEISTKLIRVTFRFVNESDKDIHTTVAFPLPLYNRLWESHARPDEPKRAMANFKVLVNGRLVATDLVRRAVTSDGDITDRLRKLGLTDKEIFFDVTSSDANKRILSEKLTEPYWWKISQTVLWEMSFPAGRETLIEHSYQPAVGYSYSVPTGDFNPDLDIPRVRSDKDNACLEDATARALEKRIKEEVAKSAKEVFVTLQDVEYILSTGRNWKGPIGSFTLRLVKERPDQFVSVCFPGKPKKVGPTVYEFHQEDFVPPDKLVVYFYTLGPEVYDGEQR